MCLKFKRDSICCTTDVNKTLIYTHVSSISALYNIYAGNDGIDRSAQQGCSHVLTWENNTV